MDMNRLTLIGRVGRDPEIKTFDNGGRIAKFSVATSERWKDKAGAQQERTEWHNVVVKNEGLVRFVETSLEKGGHVYIEGKLESRKYVGTGDALRARQGAGQIRGHHLLDAQEFIRSATSRRSILSSEISARDDWR